MILSLTKLYKVPSITTESVDMQLGNFDFFLFDCNSPGSYRRCHLPGAKHLDPADYKESDLPSNKNFTLVFYCSGILCGASAYAAKRARNMGHQKVYVMTDGLSGWIHSGRSTESML